MQRADALSLEVDVSPAPRRVRAAAALVAALIRRTARTVRLVGEWRRLDVLCREYRSRKVIFCWFNEQAVIQMVGLSRLECDAGGIPPALADVHIVCDDSYGGQVSSELMFRFSLPSIPLRWTHAIGRARDLQAIMRARHPIGIAVDGHGPYGEVGDAFGRLVSRCDAVVIPIGTAVDRFFRVRIGAPFVVPRPRASLSLTAGEPIDAAAGGDLAADIAARLRNASRTAAEHLASPPRPDR